MLRALFAQAVPPEVVKYEFDVKSNGTVASVPVGVAERGGITQTASIPILLARALLLAPPPFSSPAHC